jgi:hypothetical protein
MRKMSQNGKMAAIIVMTAVGTTLLLLHAYAGALIK